VCCHSESQVATRSIKYFSTLQRSLIVSNMCDVAEGGSSLQTVEQKPMRTPGQNVQFQPDPNLTEMLRLMAVISLQEFLLCLFNFTLRAGKLAEQKPEAGSPPGPHPISPQNGFQLPRSSQNDASPGQIVSPNPFVVVYMKKESERNSAGQGERQNGKLFSKNACACF
jgi:hypothetical protein